MSTAMPRTKLLSALLGLALSVSVASARADAPFYRVVKLPKGNWYATKLDKYSDTVIGWKYEHDATYGRTFLYKLYPKFKFIAEVSPIPDADPSITVGHEKIGSKNLNGVGFIYTNGTFAELPKLHPTDGNTLPSAISNYGVVGHSGCICGGTSYFALWIPNASGAYDVTEAPFRFPSSINDLGDITGGNKVMLVDGTILTVGPTNYYAGDVNNKRQVIGSFWNESHYEAFVWNPLSGAIKLPPLGNFTNSTAFRILDNGTVLGTSWTDATGEITLWENGVPRALPVSNLPPIRNVIGANNQGEILVSGSEGAMLLIPRKK